jgi:hypothetical protein
MRAGAVFALSVFLATQAGPAVGETVASSHPKLFSLPSVGVVRIGAGRREVTVTYDILLPRGDWKGQSLEVFVAFGAPGRPRAMDAELVPLDSGVLEPDPSSRGDTLAIRPVTAAPKSASLLLGSRAMAGVVISADASRLKRAFEPSRMAALRIRSVLEAPQADAEGLHEIVLRLGMDGDSALALGRIEVLSKSSDDTIARAEAVLCGDGADPHPLAVRATPPVPRTNRPVAPVLASRRPGDDLCIRYSFRSGR